MEQTAFDFSWAEPVETASVPDPAPEIAGPSRSPATMAEIRAITEADLTLPDARRRDLLSGLKRLEAIAGRSLADVPATAAAVRAIFSEAKPIRLGIKQKTLQTLRSSVVFALRRFGPVERRTGSPIKENWSPEWAALIGEIPIPFQRHSLSRFAAFCSGRGVLPVDVTSNHLAGFLDDLRVREAIKNPKAIVKNTVSNWNRAVRTIKGWPGFWLSSPTKPTPAVLPLKAFPRPFQADLAGWKRRVSAQPKASSIFSSEALLRPLRPATIESQLFMFRQVATALVKSGAMKLDEIDSLAALCDPDKLQIALEFEFERHGKERRVFEIANKMAILAKHVTRLSPEQVSGLAVLCSVRPKRQNQITEKNRERLSQFDDDENYRLLTSIPVRAAAQARKMKNGYRAAKLMEQAVAIALLGHVALRLTTLRTLELSWLRWQPDGSVILFIPPTATKGRRALELFLNADVGQLLREHLDRFRPSLPCSDGPYLFPGEKGGPRSKNAMYERIVAAAQGVGLEFNPHLFRHLIQKICAEVDPTSLSDVSRVLQHASPSTTLTFYADHNGRAASRRLDNILTKKAGGGEDI